MVPNASLDPHCLNLDCSQGCGSQLEAILTPGDIWQCLKAFLVVTAGKGGTTVIQQAAAAGILRNILQCIGQSSQQRITRPQTSVVLRLRKPELKILHGWPRAGARALGIGTCSWGIWASTLRPALETWRTFHLETWPVVLKYMR